MDKPEIHVLFVDDDAALREANVQSLEIAGLEVSAYPDAESALAKIGRDLTAIVVSDIRMPGTDGLQLLARVRAIDPELPVILITGHADVPMALGALKDGAFDFLTKPFAAEQLAASVRRAITARRLVLENRSLRAASAMADETAPLIGDTQVMVTLRESIVQIARADIDVLVEGETGTGKELIARMLHRLGPRRGRPFVAINCAALSTTAEQDDLFGHAAGMRGDRTGRIESSHRGTLFLDEIDSMDKAMQARLLRILEEREVPIAGGEPRAVDLRVIAASKRPLDDAAKSGAFREDLLFRLNVVRLRAPPLRDRRLDIYPLFAHFLASSAKQLGRPIPSLADQTRRHLAEHDWPGNIRELRNFAMRVALDVEPPELQSRESQESLPRRVSRFEAELIIDALRSSRGNIQQTLTILDIPRKTFYDKLTRYSIDASLYRL